MSVKAGTRPGRIKAVALLFALLAVVPGCDSGWISWRRGVNTGIAIEIGAARGSFLIYRAARKALYDVEASAGIGEVQNLIYNNGAGPISTICVGSFCLSAGYLRSVFHGLVYGRTSDLHSALRDATINFDCLALTVISGGFYEPNWTHKGVGCIIGEV